MATRKIKDAKDLSTNELIYFKGHAKATYMSNGSTVEDVINNIEDTAYDLANGKQDKLVSGTNIKTINGTSILGSGDIVISNSGGSSSGNGNSGSSVYITPFTVEQFCTSNVELTDEQRNELLNAASQNIIIGMPYGNIDYQAGYIVADYKYQVFDEFDAWTLDLEVIYNGAHYMNLIGSNTNLNFRRNRVSITPFKPLIYYVDVEDGVATVQDDMSYPDNCIFLINGECTELYIYLEPSNIGKTVRFFTGESCMLEFGCSVYWANGEIPTIDPYTHYELSLVVNMESAFNAVLTPFKLVE